MAVLTVNTPVRNPKDGAMVLLREGDTLPDWAKDLVGEHALTDDAPAQTPQEQHTPTTLYDTWSKEALLQEIADRNDALEGDERLRTNGTKAELVKALAADDLVHSYEPDTE